MSLNCLTCQNLPRVDSEKELTERYGGGGGVDHKPQPHFTLRRCKVDRNWSGNLAPRPYENVRNIESAMAGKRVKNGLNRLHASGPIGYESGPRLVRSSGMRRDWSFEDLRQRMSENIKEVQGH